jgi:hypothetical protein
MNFSLRRSAFQALDRFPPARALLIDPVRRRVLETERDRVARNYFELVRDAHKGRRGFIIGNGPSLSMSDLSQLKNEVTIASNLIHLAFDRTQWRPTYLTVIDELVWTKMARVASSHYASVIIGTGLDPALSNCLSYVVRFLGHAPLITGEMAFSADMSAGAYGGSTVTFTNLQLARHLGLNPVYLIGCDHYYNEPANIQEGVPIGDTGNNHFSPGYRQPGELVNPAPIRNMTRSFEIAQEYCGMTDFRIYNATRGGYLEVFPRCSFDSLKTAT